MFLHNPLSWKWPIIGVFFSIVLAFFPAGAVTTSIWELQTQEDFQAGKPEKVAISSLGEVTLAPELQLIFRTEEAYIWCLALDSKGNLYAGSGHEGKIFRITPEGKESLLFDSPELEVLSLALDPKGNLYAGTAPEGIIYRISPQGEASVFFDSPESYVWALAFDKRGSLYAGAGDGAKIYKISRSGKAKVVFDSEETHILCLIVDKGGNVYAGGEGKGVIYKLSPEGEVRVLYDAPEEEIHSLALGPDHSLYVGAIGGRREHQVLPGEASLGGQERAETRSVIYRISPGGTVSRLWDCPQPLVLSLVVIPDGNLLVGTGNEGLIYLLSPDGEATTLAELEPSQVLSLHLGTGGSVLLGTGNQGEIYRLNPERHHRNGTFTSPVHDAVTFSQWGRIWWEGETPKGATITLVTRTGNTAEPDQTWSEWSPEYTQPSGERITSPPARFIQWRAQLSTSRNSNTPVLRKVSVAYFQQNLRPEITSLTVHPPGKRLTRPPTAPPPEAQTEAPTPTEAEDFPQFRPPRRVPPKRSLRMITWKAKDPNGDLLWYTLYFKGLEEKNWKTLKENIKVTHHTWDTESVPDGVYEVKLVASDSPSNPPGEALIAERVSTPFAVDNTPPQVQILNVQVSTRGMATITGKGIDRMSPLKRGEYSIDAGDWQAFLPTDGIFDSKREDFSFKTGPLDPGEHTIVVRVVDTIGNVGAGKRVFEVGK